MRVPGRLLVLLVSVLIASMSLSATAQDSCGTITDISEILWQADEATRLSFGDVKTLFPSLTDPTDAEIAEAISKADQTSLPDIIINTQPSSNGKLFQRVSIPSTFFNGIGRDVTSFYDYSPVALKNENFFYETETFIFEFLNEINTYEAMKELQKYLVCKGIVSQGSMSYDLFGIWFHTYPRYPEFGTLRSADSCGFEYIFVGEYGVDARFVSGLHDWYRLYRLQNEGRVTYPGSIEVIEPNILALTFTWDGRCQPKGSLFLGSSTAFQMAIYTLCFLEMPGQDCNISLGGHLVTLQTERIVFSNEPVGNLKSAYPEVTVSQPCDACAMPPRVCGGSLTEMAEKLWALDESSRLTFEDAMTLFPDLTEWTDSSIAQAISLSDADVLPDIILNYHNNQSKFFQYVNASKLNTDVYDAFQTLVTSYIPEVDTGSNPDYYYFDYYTVPDSPVSSQDITTFVNALFSKKSMDILADHLQCRGFFTSGSIPKKELRRAFEKLWFTDYNPSSSDVPISSGFWHTFAGQYHGSQTADGPYNWYRMYMLETSGEMEELRYVGQGDPNVMTAAFTWSGRRVSKNAMWMGSSPEFEMAIYTLCHFESNSGYCRFSVGGQPVKVRYSHFTSYMDMYMESAYPERVEPQPPTISDSPSSSPTTLTPTTNHCPTTTSSTTTTTTPTTTTSTTTTTTSTTTSSTTTTTTPTTTSSTTTTTTPTTTTSSITTTTTPTTTSSTTRTPTSTTTSSTTTTPRAMSTSTSTATTMKASQTAHSTTRKADCLEGLYGPTCSEVCSMFCAGDGTCDAISGACNHGCKDGYEGRKCDTEDGSGDNKGCGLHASLTKITLLPLIMLTKFAMRILLT